MKSWNKTERESARLHVTLTHRMGKTKQTYKPLRIKLMDLTDAEYKTLTSIIEKYGY